jgi:hypothetical protein
MIVQRIHAVLRRAKFGTVCRLESCTEVRGERGKAQGAGLSLLGGLLLGGALRRVFLDCAGGVVLTVHRSSAPLHRMMVTSGSGWPVITSPTGCRGSELHGQPLYLSVRCTA